jgi:hypothetical protein
MQERGCQCSVSEQTKSTSFAFVSAGQESFLRALAGPFKRVFTPALWTVILLIHPPVFADPWTPPIGVPMPPFGILESHTMYQGQLYDYDNNGTPEGAYKDAGNGPYTHYVDRSAPNCTDGSNDLNFGTPALPRCTIPGRDGSPLKAGSVVEVHGKHDYDYTSPTDLHFVGTAAKPVFIRGASASNRREHPLLRSRW